MSDRAAAEPGAAVRQSEQVIAPTVSRSSGKDESPRAFLPSATRRSPPHKSPLPKQASKSISSREAANRFPFSAPPTPPPVGAFSSFHALIAVSRQSFASASSQPFSTSAAAASAAMAFHWKNGFVVENTRRSSGLPHRGNANHIATACRYSRKVAFSETTGYAFSNRLFRMFRLS